MQALAEEWRRRDREREALVKKKVQSLHNFHTYTLSLHIALYTAGFPVHTEY